MALTRATFGQFTTVTSVVDTPDSNDLLDSDEIGTRYVAGNKAKIFWWVDDSQTALAAALATGNLVSLQVIGKRTIDDNDVETILYSEAICDNSGSLTAEEVTMDMFDTFFLRLDISKIADSPAWNSEEFVVQFVIPGVC